MFTGVPDPRDQRSSVSRSLGGKRCVASNLRFWTPSSGLTSRSPAIEGSAPMTQNVMLLPTCAFHPHISAWLQGARLRARGCKGSVVGEQPASLGAVCSWLGISIRMRACDFRRSQER